MLLLRGMNWLGWAWMVLLEGAVSFPNRRKLQRHNRCARPAPAWPQLGRPRSLPHARLHLDHHTTRVTPSFSAFC